MLKVRSAPLFTVKQDSGPVTSRMSLRSSTKWDPDRTKDQCKRWTLHLTIFRHFRIFFLNVTNFSLKRRLKVPPRVFGPHCFLSVICQLCFHPIWIAFQWRHIWTAPGCHGPIFFQASSCVEIMAPFPRLTETNKRCDLIPSQVQRPKWWQLASSRHCHITLTVWCCVASAQSIATIKYSCILVIVPQNDLSDQPQEMESLCSNV